MTHTVSVSFGRNIGHTPMPDQEWARFRESVIELVPTRYGVFTSDAGTWQDDVVEESALVLGTVTDQELARLRDRLAELAAEYKQDAIGLIVQDGTDTLILPAVAR